MNPSSIKSVMTNKTSGNLHWRRISLLIFVALTSGVAQPAMAENRPAPLHALEKQGLTIVGTFPSPGGLTAWAAYMGQQPVALYVTPDGKHVIAGSLLDADGKDINQGVLEKAVSKQMTDGVWGRLQTSRWVADGSDKAPKIVYVFTDPNCPFCSKFWSDARPWVNSEKVQLRHIIVGILTPTSSGKAAALLAGKDPSSTLYAYESNQATGNLKALAAGQPHPLSDNGLHPLSNIPPAIQQQLAANEKTMLDLGLRATPAIVWRNSKGVVQMRTGAPEQALEEILGPR